jgi:hypothetical protein
VWGYCSAVRQRQSIFLPLRARMRVFLPQKLLPATAFHTAAPRAENGRLWSVSAMKARIDQGLSLLFVYLGKIDLADYLHSDWSSIIGCNDFLHSFHDIIRWEPDGSRHPWRRPRCW